MIDKIFIDYYETISGKIPYFEWFDKQDSQIRAIIIIRLARVRRGLFGDCTPIKNSPSMWELCFTVAAGYRVYYGKIDTMNIMVLWGGIKKSQNRDIDRATKYWDDCKNRGIL